MLGMSRAWGLGSRVEGSACARELGMLGRYKERRATRMAKHLVYLVRPFPGCWTFPMRLHSEL